MSTGKEERIDIYDAQRRPTGRTKPRHGEGSRLERDEYMLYALALLENARGEFLITRRSLDKKWAAGAWEIPGGGASAGDSSRDAVNREVREETGLDVSSCTPVSVYTYRNDDPEGGDNYFCDIYHFRLDFAPEQVRIQRDEVLEWRTASEEEITRLWQLHGFLHYERIGQALEAEKKG